MEIIGWISSILFCICAIPQAIQTYKVGHTNGISTLFILAWFFGEVLGIIYAIHLGNLPILFNYSVNFISLLVILKYRFSPRV